MALFKVSYGAKSNLVNQTIKDGFCWYTPEDGKFYIDTLLPEIDDENANLLSANNTYVSKKYLNSAGNEGSSNSWQYTSNYITVEPNTTYIAKDLFPNSSAGYEDWHNAYLILYDSNQVIVGTYNILLRQNIIFNTGTANSLRTSVRIRNYGGGSGDPPAVICTINHMQKRNALSAIPVSYGVCATGTSTVTIPGISLTNGVPPEGAMICVRFEDGNSGSAKSITVNNGYITSNSIAIISGYWTANSLVGLVYDGTNWIVQSDNSLESYYDLTQATSGDKRNLFFSDDYTDSNLNDKTLLQVKKDNALVYYPYSGKLATNKIALGTSEPVVLQYNTTTQALDFIFN